MSVIVGDEREGLLAEFAKAFKHWVDHDAPTEEWDGGTLGYEVGGLYAMADEALRADSRVGQLTQELRDYEKWSMERRDELQRRITELEAEREREHGD